MKCNMVKILAQYILSSINLVGIEDEHSHTAHIPQAPSAIINRGDTESLDSRSSHITLSKAKH